MMIRKVITKTRKLGTGFFYSEYYKPYVKGGKVVYALRQVWVAKWYLADEGKQMSKEYSVKQYGYEKARKLAKAKRREMELIYYE